MALPSTWDNRGDGVPALTGLAVMLVPGDLTFGVEVERTSDDGTGVAASTGATSIANWSAGVLPDIGGFLTDYLPADNQNRFYRARHVGPGYDAGAWTGWTTGHKPGVLRGAGAQQQVSGYPLKRDRKMTDGGFALAAANATGSEFRADVYLPSTYLLNVGTTGSPGSIPKSVKIPFTELAPSGSTYSYNQGNGVGYLSLLGASTISTVWTGSAIAPPGVTLTEFHVNAFRDSTSPLANIELYRQDGDGAQVQIALVSHASSTWATPSAVLSQLVSSSQGFTVRATIANGTGGTNSVRLGDMLLLYTMPSYDKGY